MKTLLAVLGSMTSQGPVCQWVSDHRKHHAHSDVEGDPHSPHVGSGVGLMGAVRGFWHSHLGWLFSTKGLVVKTKYAARPARGRDRAQRRPPLLPLGDARLRAPVRRPATCSAGLRGGVEAMIWGGLVRIAVFQHITWSVNSICHMFGRRDFDVRDESRNNWLLALPSLRRGVAQQPPCLPVVGGSRARPFPVRLLGARDPRARADRSRLGREGAGRHEPGTPPGRRRRRMSGRARPGRMRPARIERATSASAGLRSIP